MFKLDSPLMNFLSKVADIMILNVLFIVFSIPIVTIGASFSAAYYMGYKMVKNEETYIVRGFWKAFKENFKQATIMWIVILLVSGLLGLDYRIMYQSGIVFPDWTRIAVMAVTFVFMLGLSFVFPLQARFVNPVKNTMKNAFLMALSHLPTAFLLVAVYAVPVIAFIIVPQAFPAIFLLGFGIIIYIQSFLTLRVFTKYESVLATKAAPEEDSDSGIFAESDRIEREQKDANGQKGAVNKVFRNGRFVEVSENSKNSDK